MASDKLGTVPAPQIHNGLSPHPQLVFPEGFACGPLRLSAAANPCTRTATTRELTASFFGHRNYFQPHPLPPPPHQAGGFRHQWNANSRSSGGDTSDDDDDDENGDADVEDKEDEEEEEEEEKRNYLERAVTVAKIGEGSRNELYSSNSNSQKMKHISELGIKEGNVGKSVNENNGGGELMNARGGETYYSQYLKYLNSAEGPSTSSGQKEMVVENECGFSGKKEGSYCTETGDSLRAILSDPITGILMDDALILPCGHSFGSGGIQQVLRVKACFTCSQPVLEDSVAPNLSLRLAVQAFRREEALQADHSLKRRRERYEKGTYDSIFTDHPRGRGPQFPFAVTDRVIIKGNKRTPPRFVGREAIVTTQCLNGWYVVKTLDNAESVKLQYRSLAKIPDGPSGKR